MRWPCRAETDCRSAQHEDAVGAPRQPCRRSIASIAVVLSMAAILPHAAAQSASEVAAAASAIRGASEPASSPVGATPKLVRIEPPRDTARHIGDVVVYRALIALPTGWAPDRDGVPGVGVEGRPIELRSQSMSAADEAGCAGCVWLSLRWQIFKGLRGAEDLKTAPTPVRLRQGDRIAVVTLPPAVLAVSPLVNWEMRPDWLNSMRPGWHALPFDVQARLGEAVVALGAAAVAGMGWLWSSGRWLPRRGARPFAEALRSLRARHRADPRAAADADDLRQWHRAFDASAGEAVFAETLAAYFSARPAFAPLADAAQAMFAASREAFFLSPEPSRDTCIRAADLIALVQRLARAEFASNAAAPHHA
jgi:mxaA protein